VEPGCVRDGQLLWYTCDGRYSQIAELKLEKKA